MYNYRSDKRFSLIVFIALIAGSCIHDSKILFADGFRDPLDTNIWVPEIAPMPSSGVCTRDGKLVIDTRGGVTVWLNKQLKGNILIEFDRKVIVADGENDRLSDLNMFWMASDSHNPEFFSRTGVFEEYDSLLLYYAGIGGNNNTTTRFRKYTGDGTRLLLQEYDDPEHLLSPDHTYHIKIEVFEDVTSLWVDGVLYFTFSDPSPLLEGYFGFRSTWSHQEISNFRVFHLQSYPEGK